VISGCHNNEPRSPSLSSSKSEEEYHIRVKKDSNRMDKDDSAPTSSSINLEYATQGGQNNQVSKAADPTLNMRMQGISTAQPALNMPASKNVFNVQLNYDPNQILDPDS